MEVVYAPMLRLFNRFLIFILLLSLAAYVVVLNRDTATLRLGSTWEITSAAGFIYIGVLLTGCLLTFLVALAFGAWMFFRERKLINLERRRQSFDKTILQARSYLASGEWLKARDLWQQIIRKDPDNIVARVELSRSFEGSGDLIEALRTLDMTRGALKENTEVLFRAAELNARLGNKTAALDNLGLILRQHPNRRAARMARDLAEELGKLQDALVYQTQVENFGGTDEDSSEVRARLNYQSLVRDAGTDTTRLNEALTVFVKKNPTFIPAVEHLGDIRRAAGNLDEAADLWIRSARASSSSEGWLRVANLWLDNSNGDATRRAEKALAALRSACADARGVHRLRAEIMLAKTLLGVGKLEECRKILEGFPDLAGRESVVIPQDLHYQALALRGLCYQKLGLERDAHALWPLFLESVGRITSSRSPAAGWSRTGEPSPVFSTP